MDIADLNLSVRAYNAVCRAGIKTIPELYEKYQLDLAQLSREIGPNHTKEVGDALTKHREEVWDELRKEDEEFRQPKAGDYLCDYDPEIWGEAVTFDEMTQMVGELVIVNTGWYPEDTLEEDGEGDVLLVMDADGDVVHLRGDTPKIHEITRQDMEGIINTRRFCTKVWRIKESEEIDNMNQEGNTLSIESPYFASMRLALDQMLQKTVDRMMRKASSDGTVTLKISLSLNDAMLQNGETIRQPVISHKITSSITSRETVDGFVAGDYALEFDEQVERYVLRELPPEGGQMTLI